jgi:hypothetical protein
LTYDERGAFAEWTAKVAQKYVPVIVQEEFPKGVPPEVKLFVLRETSPLPANAFTMVEVLVTYVLQGRLTKTYSVQCIDDFDIITTGDALLKLVDELFTFSTLTARIVQSDIEENDRFSDVGVVKQGNQETITVHSVRYRLSNAATISIDENRVPTIQALFIPTPNLKDRWLTATVRATLLNLTTLRPDDPYETNTNTGLGALSDGVSGQ